MQNMKPELFLHTLHVFADLVFHADVDFVYKSVADVLLWQLTLLRSLNLLKESVVWGYNT